MEHTKSQDTQDTEHIFMLVQGLAKYGWDLTFTRVRVDSSHTVLEHHRPLHSYLC